MPKLYTVKFTKRALKDLAGLDKATHNKILESLPLLEVNPFAEILQFKKLRGQKSLYRIRIGNYRVVYEVRGAELIIVVIRIGHRKDVYRYL
jgi:mRNA interferase RelE/StbE